MPTGTEELDVKVYIDYPQERLGQKGPYIFCTDGTHIDPASKTNCFIDPVTLSTFGMPLPMTPEWSDKTTPTTGHYSRYQIYDFNFTGTGGAVWWNFNQYKKPGNSYIFSISDDAAIQSAPIELANDVVRNEPLFFSYSKLDKKSSDNTVSFKLNWKNSLNSDKDIQLHFRSDGSCDVYRGYVPLTGNISTFSSSAVVSGHNTKFLTELAVGTFIYDFYGRILGQVAVIHSDVNLDLYTVSNYVVTNLSYNKKVPRKIQNYSRTENNYNTSKPITATLSPNDQFNDIYIIPCRGRDLLVLTSFGLNFCHTFDDLNVPNPPNDITQLPGSQTPIITPTGKFSIEILNGKIAFQLAKLYFLSKWSAFSQTITTPNPPPVLPSYFVDINGDAERIQFTKDSITVTGFGTSFISEVNPGDRLLAYTEDYQTIFVGIIDFVSSNTSLGLFDFPKFDASDVLNQGINTGKVRFTSNHKLDGTISFSLDSSIVNGTGTHFTSELELGDYLYTAEGIFIGIVQAIVSDTNLALFKNTNIAGSNISYYANLNQYNKLFKNIQYEKFGKATYTDPNNIGIDFLIVDGVGNADPFDGENQNFKIKIKGTSEDADPLTSDDWGFMFYSADYIFNMLNVYTSNSTIDITTALTSFSLKRNENGDMVLNLESRTKFLEDLGVVKPDIIADRPIKVVLEPRNKILSGKITINETDIVTGVNTLFTTELSVGDTIYKDDGTQIGIVKTITNDTNLTLVIINPALGIEYNIDYKKTNNLPFTIFEGYLSSPEIEYILGENYDVYPNLRFSAICKKQQLNNTYFEVAPNFDNTKLVNLIDQCIIMGGSGNNDPNQVNIDSSTTIETFFLPINRNNSNGQYNFGFNIGDTPGGFIEKVRSDFANNFTFFHKHIYLKKQLDKSGWDSYMAFALLDLNQISSQTPPVILYLNEKSAEDYGGIPIYESYKRTIRSLSKTYEQPEANRVAVIGIDKSTSNRINVVLDDSNSQYSQALPINRPNNWLGLVSPFVYASEKLNSYADVYQVADQYFNRITTGRELIEFESDILTWYDNTSNIAIGPNLLDGQITIDTTVNVSGVGTSFLSQLEVGQSIYESDTGLLIGVIVQIIDDYNLVLLSNHINTVKYNIDYSKNIDYLNEYRMIDIGDIISIADLNNNIENYMIIDWDFQVIKDNHLSNNINVRSAKYRAKKVTVPAFDSINFSFNVSIDINEEDIQPAANQKIITYDDALDFFIVVLNSPEYSNNVITLSNQPANMAFTGIGSGTIVLLEFNPDNTQINQVYNDILITATNSEGSVITYTFSVRVYDSL